MSEREEFEAWVKSQAPQVRMLTLWDAWQVARATEQPAAVPEGWKLVPIEPTEEMLNVYHGYYRSGKGYLDLSIWRDMLAAAPQPSPAPKTAACQKYQD